MSRESQRRDMGETSDERYSKWLDLIETEGLNLTPWEEDFIESIRNRFDRGWRTLSDKQADILERIYAEKTP